MVKRDRKRQPVLKDWHLWSQVTRSVSPLKRAAPSLTAPMLDLETSKEKTLASPAKNKPSQSHQVNPPTWSPPSTPASNPASDPASDIEPRIRRRLMRGQLPIDATLDLHGLRQSEAHAVLCRFVAARHARGDRTILVITGKGLKKTGYGSIEQRGVLRTMLPIWLSEPVLAPLIAGWEVSAQAHGGEGAYYVRLRRAQK